MDESTFQSGWRIVATLPPGTPLVAGVDALCSRHEVTEAEIRLTGAVRDASIALGDDADPIPLPGTSQLVLAHGHLVPDLGVTGFSAVLAWSDRGQARVLAGFLERATSAGVRVVIESFSPVEAERPTGQRPASSHRAPPAAATTRTSSEAPRTAEPVRAGVAPVARATAVAAPPSPATPPAASPAPAPATSGWGAAVAASKAAPPPSAGPGRPGQPPVTSNGAGPLDEDPDPKPGDVLIHPQFGRCKAMSTAENDRVKIRMATGRFIDLHLGYVRLVRQADEDGQRVFRVQPTKR